MPLIALLNNRSSVGRRRGRGRAGADGARAADAALRARSDAERRPALLCVAQSFTPDTTPTAIRAGALLRRLSAQWDISVLTEARQDDDGQSIQIELVASRRPRRLLATIRRLRLSKLLELLVWPDDSIFWVIPAILAGRRLIRERAPDAIVVFMMPYSAGLVGVALRRLSGLPLVLNLDDSLTCTDMHPVFPTALHYRLARALEDFYARTADATIYVSATNLEAVRKRAPERVRERLHLVRYGADVAAFSPQQAPSDRFEVAYVGAMSGWWALIGQDESPGRAKAIYDAWTRLGRHELIELDPRTSSPAALGHALNAAIAAHPEWAGWLKLTLYGNPYPADVVDRALRAAGVERVVEVLGPVAHERVSGILARADLLFITLPLRVDGSRGGRISAKTYEYLMTDRPILAAVPRGENWDYLAGKPGVWLVEPDDERGMQAVVAELAEAKAAGAARTYDRSALRGELSYDARAGELAGVIREGIARGEAPRP
jgi:Glycosyltransferase Family 4